MTSDTQTTIIILLVGGYWVQLIYRLHKAENEIADLRKELGASTTAVAVAAANALSAAAAALKGK